MSAISTAGNGVGAVDGPRKSVVLWRKRPANDAAGVQARKLAGQSRDAMLIKFPWNVDAFFRGAVKPRIRYGPEGSRVARDS